MLQEGKLFENYSVFPVWLESNNQGKSNEVKCGIYSNPKEMDNEKEKMVFTHVRFISSHQKITVFFHF
jgi:hypothetical protein